MPDISLRFHKDLLVLSAPLDTALNQQGANAERDQELMLFVEPDSMAETLRMEKLAGAQVLVAPTADITPLQLTHKGMEDTGAHLAEAALDLVVSLEPQHVLAEIAPCGLPLDASSKASLNENRSQYARAAHAFDGQTFDAFFLNGFTNTDDLKCALMGVRQVSDALVFASVGVLPDGTLTSGRGTLEEAAAVMNEYGASVVGFATVAGPEEAEALAKRMVAVTELPVLAQLEVLENNPKQGIATKENPYFCPDALVEAGEKLCAAGVQFLRAVGQATPAYTGALVVSTLGKDVLRPDIKEPEEAPTAPSEEEIAARIADLRAQINEALGNKE